MPTQITQFTQPPAGMRRMFTLAAKGFAMGAADVVPGVSGGTMAFILGIYEQLIDAIHRLGDPELFRAIASFRFRDAIKHIPFGFLLTLGSGILLAILTFARVIEVWLVEHPSLLWAFFFGLVAASVVAVFHRVARWSADRWVALILGAVAAFLIVGLVPARTPSTWWFLFLCGSLAICAMILPGISGSFILLLLGQYQTVLGAINDRNIGIIAVVGAGAVVGIITFTRFLYWLLGRFHDLTVAVLIGFMAGSLRKIWPWKETLETALDRHGMPFPVREANVFPAEWTTETAAALGLAALGFLVVIVLERLARPGKVTKPPSGG